ncbi:MAG: DUF4331 domain-containing protein [Actinomycetota bacterium]
MRSRLRVAALAGTATVALTAGVLTGLGPVPGGASSHREAPLISADPQADTTDVYMFRSPDNPDTVTMVASWLPFEEPAGGPNFYRFDDQASYDFNISNDGDAKPEMVLRFDFTDHLRSGGTFLYNTGPVTSLDDPDLNFFQTYDLSKLTFKDVKKKIKRPNGKKRTKRFTKTKTQLLVDDAPVGPSRVGDASMPDYPGQLFQPAVTPFLDGAAKTWAGQSDDAFFLDLRVFDLLYGADFSEAGDETLLGFNVQSIAVQLPRSFLAKDGDVDANPVIGTWATTSRRSTRVLKPNGTQKHVGKLVQVSRLGMPLVNEVVIPIQDKDRWNASRPKDDAQFLSYVTDPELPKLIQAIYGIPAPATPRDDLVQVFLTGIPGLNQPAGVQPSEMLRLNMTTPVCEPGTCPEYSRLGVIGGDVAGYPNGRRLADDVIDISLQVVEGELVGSPNDLADGVDANPEGFGSSFPFAQVPTTGSDPDPH